MGQSGQNLGRGNPARSRARRAGRALRLLLLTGKAPEALLCPASPRLHFCCAPSPRASAARLETEESKGLRLLAGCAGWAGAAGDAGGFPNHSQAWAPHGQTDKLSGGTAPRDGDAAGGAMDPAQPLNPPTASGTEPARLPRLPGPAGTFILWNRLYQAPKVQQ